MSSRHDRLLRGFALAAVTVFTATCTDVTDIELLEIAAAGAVGGQVYLDLNGSGALEAEDEPLIGVTVRLVPVAGGPPVAQTETDADGAFLLQDVPVGRYELGVESELLGDSLRVSEAPDPVQITPAEVRERVVGLAFHELTIEEVRTAAPGRRVLTTGIALNPRQPFSDGRVFLRGADAYLQAVDVARSPAVAVGDSVRFLGRTGRAGGRPALVDVMPFILIGQAQVPTPLEVDTDEAADADGGALDGALVRITSATVSDTATVGGDFTFRADDGSGEVEVVLRAFLGFTLRPPEGSEIASASGMLQPVEDGGGVRWRLLVRSAGELTLAPAPGS